jgi:hypothetical protein
MNTELVHYLLSIQVHGEVWYKPIIKKELTGAIEDSERYLKGTALKWEQAWLINSEQDTVSFWKALRETTVVKVN